MGTLTIDSKPSHDPSTQKQLNVLLWVMQALLAAVFLFTGVAKLFFPLDQLATSMAWITAAPVALVRFIGLAELAGAIGLVVPGSLHIAPRLTQLAALGLTVVMAAASVFHVARGEYPMLVTTVSLGGLAFLVAWARDRQVPLPSRQHEDTHLPQT